MVNLQTWQEKYETARSAYSGRLELYKEQQKQYEGDRTHKGKAGSQKPKVVWNFTKELIESAIDSNIPQPKVESNSTGKVKKKRAAIVETMIRNEMKRLCFIEINDQDERTTKITGGNFVLTEWDNADVTRYTVGAVREKLISPLQLIPQEKVNSIEDMDYFFLTFEDTKQRIKDRYGVDVEDEDTDPRNTESPAENDLVTQVMAFYKNSKGNVGLFSWVGDTVIADHKDYNARKNTVCAKCGENIRPGEKKCRCGASEWTKTDTVYETFEQDYVNAFGTVIPAMSYVKDEYGEVLQEDYEEQAIDPLTGAPMFEQIFDFETQMPVGEVPLMQTLQRPVLEPTKIPYYIPKEFPVAARKNVSLQNEFLGDSDCETIWEVQDSVNKVLSKAYKKAINSGSVLAKPQDVQYTPSNEDFAVVEIENPQQLSSLKAVNLEFNVSQALAIAESGYQMAKSMLGITDSFQGKPDTTAQSGKAKEIQVMQSSGRQTSKKAMKEACYIQIFKNIFHYMLAYSDEPRRYIGKDEEGQEVELVFDRRDFLEQDEFGNWYYDDDFLFGVDQTASMFTDKQYQLEDLRTDFSLGAYGDRNSPEAMVNYWKVKEDMKYPNASRMLTYWQGKADEVEELQKIQQQILGGGFNEMPPMPQRGMALQDNA